METRIVSFDIRSALRGSTSLSTSHWRIFTYSRTITPTYDMEADVHVVGGGATGGVAGAPAGSANHCSATGGGGPGYSKKRVRLKAGVTYTLTIGAGGASVVAAPSTTSALTGNNGNDSSFVGGEYNIVARGGRAGNAITNSLAAVLGGLGGEASGGDINYTGGRGGNIGAGSGSPTGEHFRATGGGAVNFIGEVGHGGDIAGGPYTGSIVTQKSAGAGIGGNGADVAFTTTSSPVGSGGGVGSLSNLDPTSAITLTSRAFLGFWPTLGPTTGVSGTSGPGCGAGTSGKPGPFGGGPGTANSTGNIPGVVGEHCTYGGASGGLASNSASNPLTTGKGGDGFIVMEVLS